MNTDFNIEILDWDSNFFGCKVGLLRDDSCRVEFSEVRNVMQARNIEILYLLSPTPLPISFNSYYVVTQITFEASLNESRDKRPNRPEVSTIHYPNQLATDELRSLAYEAGCSSRFQLDPHITTYQFCRMYDQWIDRSCTREIADTVLVSNHADRLTGFMTLKRQSNFLQIGLIAVGKHYRGKGIGSLLIEKAFEYGRITDCELLRVVTQSNNASAIKLYEKSGMQMISTQYFYHLWSCDFEA